MIFIIYRVIFIIYQLIFKQTNGHMMVTLSHVQRMCRSCNDITSDVTDDNVLSDEHMVVHDKL